MNHRTSSAKLAILTMSVVQMGATVIAPVLAEIQTLFPQAGTSTVQFLMTFPSLLIIVFSLLAAKIAQYLPKKYISALGCALFMAGGILSWLFHSSLWLLYLWAAITGAGIGLVVPMAPSLVSDCFSGQERQTVMGWQSSAANIGGMIMTFLGGFLAQYRWNLIYLVYLIALPGLVLTLTGLPRKTESLQAHSSDAQPSASLGKLLTDPVMIAGCAVVVIATMLFNLVPTNLSMYLAQRGLGTAADAGIGTALLLLGGTLGGILFGLLAPKLGRGVMALGFTLLTLGLVLCLMAPNLLFVYAGCLLGGCCISLVIPQIMLLTTSRAGNHPMAPAMVMSFSNFGGFLTPLITILVGWFSQGEAVAPRLWVGAVCALVMAVFLALSTRKTRS